MGETLASFDELSSEDQAKVIRLIADWEKKPDSGWLSDELKNLPFSFQDIGWEMIQLREAARQLDTPLWEELSG